MLTIVLAVAAALTALALLTGGNRPGQGRR